MHQIQGDNKSDSVISAMRALKRARLDVSNVRSRLRDEDKNFIATYHEELYTPTQELIDYLNDFKAWSLSQRNHKGRNSKETTKDIGDRMEKLARLVFQSLNCDLEIATFTSFASQIDLVVFGHANSDWDLIMDEIGLRDETEKIIIEAKNINSQIDSNTFSRLCFIVENQYPDQCRLGIFFSSKGAKGFPKEGEKQTALRSARATQIIFHARTRRKYIVVFDEKDILNLENPGELIRQLRGKISDIENVVGTHLVQQDPKGLNWSSHDS